MTIARLLLVAAALMLVPAAAFAQADDGAEAAAVTASDAATPSLECRGTGLKIMAAEVGGARFVCQVSGAPARDSTFAVEATNTADQTHTTVSVCSGNLVGGAGTCSGAFIDRASIGLPQVSLAVTLQPSGAALGPVVIGPAAPANAASEPMQFYPLGDQP